MKGPLSGFVLAAAFLAGFGGCARYYWSRPGSTPEEFDRDSRQCAEEAMRGVPAVPEHAYRACLAAQGYVREKQVEPPPSGSHRGLEDEDQFPAFRK